MPLDTEKLKGISVRLRSELLAKLDRISVEEERSRGWIINKAVEEYLEKRERMPGN